MDAAAANSPLLTELSILPRCEACHHGRHGFHYLLGTAHELRYWQHHLAQGLPFRQQDVRGFVIGR
ncbi:hypothetical protein N7478_011260 [Penicillium angulare]|uniref:uncharacterized protein n=1 Tax=Penicillium angulare TaxID=116970 RepID=UPI0025417EE1|nr:uncharacterized protein N7478_011260 [Penicillium angulare]KAJ5263655.1 hypothetical protein N7478_011260 [Penicillium angulare]